MQQPTIINNKPVTNNTVNLVNIDDLLGSGPTQINKSPNNNNNDLLGQNIFGGIIYINKTAQNPKKNTNINSNGNNNNVNLIDFSFMNNTANIQQQNNTASNNNLFNVANNTNMQGNIQHPANSNMDDLLKSKFNIN
jgi:hypothetical protein